METLFSRNRFLVDYSCLAGGVELCVRDIFGTSQKLLAVVYRRRNTQGISFVVTGKCEILIKFESLLIKTLSLGNKGMCYF